MRWMRPILLPLALGILLPPALRAQNPSQGLSYQLLGQSYVLEDCPVCGRPAIPSTLSGDFRVLVLSSNQTEVTLLLANLNWSAGSVTNPSYTITGSGSWIIQSQLFHRVALRLNIEDHLEKTNKIRNFT